MATTVIYSDMGDVDCASIPLLWEGIPDVTLLRLAKDSDWTKQDIKAAIQNANDTLIMAGHGSPMGLLGYVCEWCPERTYTSWDYAGSYRRPGRSTRAGSGRTMSMAEMYARLKQDPTIAGELGPMVKKAPAEKPGEPAKPVEPPKPKMVKRTMMEYAVDSSMAKDIHAERVIAVWCHASEYAERHKLYGFWSSMFISNSGEARFCGIYDVPQQTIVDETVKFWRDANSLLKNNVPLDQWIDHLMEMGNLNYKTTKFNYDGLRYYPR